mmetsp:Transcript_3474/g.5110  ORF Transcript_3474/g.5110 Transcript_3474/m.5110 type:complete len:234 (+) Transcript_3474:235-936(+)
MVSMNGTPANGVNGAYATSKSNFATDVTIAPPNGSFTTPSAFNPIPKFDDTNPPHDNICLKKNIGKCFRVPFVLLYSLFFPSLNFVASPPNVMDISFNVFSFIFSTFAIVKSFFLFLVGMSTKKDTETLSLSISESHNNLTLDSGTAFIAIPTAFPTRCVIDMLELFFSLYAFINCFVLVTSILIDPYIFGSVGSVHVAILILDLKLVLFFCSHSTFTKYNDNPIIAYGVHLD